MPSTPAKRSISSFFTRSTSSNNDATSSSNTPNKRNKLATTTQTSKVEDKAKGKQREIETIELDDEDSQEIPQPIPQQHDQDDDDDDDDDDDIIIVDDPGPSPKASSSKQSKPPPSPSKHAIASIFDKPTPSPSTKPSTLTVKQESDLKPDLKPSLHSPTKMLSIFDTSSASASSLPTPSSSSSPSPPLDTPLFSFTPSPSHFHPHSKTPFSFLTCALVLLSSTKSRLLIQQVLTNLLRTVVELDPLTLESVVYLLSNRIGPSYEGGELGVGWQVLSKAIKETSGATSQKLKALGNKLGDPGDIAFEASKSVRLLLRPSPLMCHSVYSTLLQISRLKGTGVLAQKTSLVKKMLLSAQGEEVRFVVRILVSNLRIGAVRLTLLTSLARCFCLSGKGGGGEYWINEEEREIMQKIEMEDMIRMENKSKSKKGGKGRARKDKGEVELRVEEKLERAVKKVRKVWARHPNFGDLVKALLDGGLDGLEERVGLTVGVPLEPMLGSITRSLPEIYTRLASRPFVSEAKLDGQRGQIHVWVSDPSLNEPSRPPGVSPTSGMFFSGQDVGDSKVAEGLKGKKVWVRLFSRHLEDMTMKYPDLIGTVAALVVRQEETESKLRNFIIDCEVVAIDPNNGDFKTFQELSYRSKKDVELGDIKVRVGIYCFDLMFLNDESLLSTPFRRRREILRTVFAPHRPTDPRFAKWELIPCCLENDLEKVREFFDECLGMKAEGIMVKLLDEAEIEVDPNLPTDADQLEELEEEGTADDEVGSGCESMKSESEEKKGKGKAIGVKEEHVIGKGGKGKKRKLLPATYEPDKRAMSWLKVKKDYMEDLGDSLDLVVIGAWHGSGRKKDWWSPFLLACYDEETGAYTAVTKCLSGFGDAFYKSMREKYSPDAENPLTSHECWPEVEAGSLNPDIWFKPTEVWEIRGADFTLSPVYPAAQSLLGERGCSIRFPRFIKIRDDKSIENATTAEQLAALYHKQGERPAGKGKAKEEEADGQGDEE